jgi:hypothetical protein
MSRLSLRIAALIVVALVGLPDGPSVAHAVVANAVRIHDTSEAVQVDRPVSIARPFRPGEIRTSAGASIDDVPLLTQCDIKSRWPDGSIKFAIVSFVVPRLPARGSVEVVFRESSQTGAGDGLTQADMLEPRYDFEAGIHLQGARSERISARAMLAAGHWRYWLKGPVVTAIIIEDRSPARGHDKDFGDGSRALHPIFEAWFYPQSRTVELGYTLENTWASHTPAKGMRDLRYGFELTAGHATARSELTQPPFTHIGRSRWHRRLALGPTLGSIRVDHNLAYLVTTRAVPNYDTGLRISEPLIAAKYAEWMGAPKNIEGDQRRVGNYDRDLAAAGARDWIGLLTTWDTLYLLTMDDRMREMALGNADLAGRIPWHFREADSGAGTGRFFDAPGTGVVESFGRVVSVNARRTVSLWDLSSRSDCGHRDRADRINTGTVSNDGWQTSRDHMPDTAYLAYLLTGRYYYLEELQYLAAFVVAHRTGCYSNEQSYHRQGDRGYLHDGQVRGDAWGFRTLAYAAFISPDGTPERAYFDDKLRNNIAAWEGEHEVPLSDPSRLSHWNWARAYGRDPKGVSPLGSWKDRDERFVQPPLYTDGRLLTAGAGWEEHFLVTAFGLARGFGYPTDGLLRFMARLRLNLLLNPQANPHLIEAYRWPHKLAATGTWVQTYASFTAQFAEIPGGWERDTTADHGYGFIALAALSYLTPYTVDGYRGEAAWARYKSEKPDQGRFVTESPKWAIVPLPAPTGHPRRSTDRPSSRMLVEPFPTHEEACQKVAAGHIGEHGPLLMLGHTNHLRPVLGERCSLDLEHVVHVDPATEVPQETQPRPDSVGDRPPDPPALAVHPLPGPGPVVPEPDRIFIDERSAAGTPKPVQHDLARHPVIGGGLREVRHEELFGTGPGQQSADSSHGRVAMAVQLAVREVHETDSPLGHSQHAACRDGLSSPKLRELGPRHELPMRVRPIRHEHHADLGTLRHLQSDRAAAAECLVVGMRREHHRGRSQLLRAEPPPHRSQDVQ